MPNIKKRTDTKRETLSLAFRFRSSEIGNGAIANHMLKSWCFGTKRMLKAENLARHNDPKGHAGFNRAKRREGLKRTV